MSYLIGIDISTTGAKAIIIDPSGNILASKTTEYPLKNPYPLWSEQSPMDWWQGACHSIHHAIEEAHIKSTDIVGVGLTGQMHGLVLLDRAGTVLRPAILWNDQRTGKQCDEITARVTRQKLLSITGNPALTGFTASKILWVRENEPDTYAQVAHILLPKDYIRFCLTGSFAIDCAEASGMNLLDIRKRNWSQEILNLLDIPVEWLPEVFEGPEITGGISPEAALATGLPVGIPVIGGGGDQAAQAVGVGAIHPGVVALTLGTSGVIFAPVNQPFIEPEGRLHAMCHSSPPGAGSGWHLMGVMLSAAGSLRWLHDTLTPDLEYDNMLAPSASIPCGSEGLIFLPYLTGERTPYPDPLARGAFIGLTIRHTWAHMVRSVLEGVAFGLKDSMELVRGAGLGEIHQVRVSGGGSRSALWRQILADVIGCELVTVNITEGASYGAALLAGVGSGIWKDVPEACAATVKTGTPTAPNLKAMAKYQEVYPIYRSLYPSLQKTFTDLSRI